MEMPTPCQNCGDWFDLHDGYGSKKWYPKTVICQDCFEKEEEEIEEDEEIQELEEEIPEIELELKEKKEKLKTLKDKRK